MPQLLAREQVLNDKVKLSSTINTLSYIDKSHSQIHFLYQSNISNRQYFLARRLLSVQVHESALQGVSKFLSREWGQHCWSCFSFSSLTEWHINSRTRGFGQLFQPSKPNCRSKEGAHKSEFPFRVRESRYPDQHSDSAIRHH